MGTAAKWLPNSLGLFTVCVCVCVCNTHWMAWMGKMQSTNSEYGTTYLATPHVTFLCLALNIAVVNSGHLNMFWFSG